MRLDNHGNELSPIKTFEGLLFNRNAGGIEWPPGWHLNYPGSLVMLATTIGSSIRLYLEGHLLNGVRQSA